MYGGIEAGRKLAGGDRMWQEKGRRDRKATGARRLALGSTGSIFARRLWL